jgi:hypothetical protein
MRCVLSARFPGEEEGGQIDTKESISQFFKKQNNILKTPQTKRKTELSEWEWPPTSSHFISRNQI